MFSGHEQSEDFEICGRLGRRTFSMVFSPCLEIAQLVTRATQSSGGVAEMDGVYSPITPFRGGFWEAGSPLAGHDIGPQGLELIWLEEIPPWRHLILAARHRIDEALALVGWEFPQVECRAGILHVRAMTRRAVDRVELRADCDLAIGKTSRLFSGRWCRHKETCQGNR